MTDAGTRAPRVAIVHDRFTELGGAEVVAEELGTMWPDATVFAALVDRAVLPPRLARADVRPSLAQRFYRGGRVYAHLLPLLPLAIARLDLRGFDVVVASHYAFANRIRPPADVPVVSFTHTPARWMWMRSMRAVEVGGRIGRAALGAFAATQRRPDAAAARRARAVVANSRSVQTRIRAWWGIDAEVVAPPVDVEFYSPDPTIAREDFFLFAGRLVPYKHPEVAAAAARRAGVRLVVAGDGRSRRAVAQAAPPDAEVLGTIDATTLRDLYRRCAALVLPGEEDFGIVPVEAQACGAPVLALGAGGALDTVVDGETGVLYRPDGEEHVDVLARALRSFDPTRFDPATIRRHAERFAPDGFRARMAALVERVLAAG